MVDVAVIVVVSSWVELVLACVVTMVVVTCVDVVGAGVVVFTVVTSVVVTTVDVVGAGVVVLAVVTSVVVTSVVPSVVGSGVTGNYWIII